ncbi:MAG: glycosyltransferase [Panacagrimonas sp.]
MKPTICLNMIVRNDAHVLERCLNSVRGVIGHWVIVDTGSTDGTRERVRELLKGIPGELHERPWRDFGSNRTEAIRLARGKAEYVLILDADEQWTVPEKYRVPKLRAMSYNLRHLCADQRLSTWKQSLLSDRVEWTFNGVLRELVDTTAVHEPEYLEKPAIKCFADGGRTLGKSARDLHVADATMLASALQADPANGRYAFYLADSLRDAGDLAAAVEAYEHRIAMGGWDEEVWCSMYALGRIAEWQKADAAIVVSRYLRAYQFRPQRAEPLFQLARYHRERSEIAIAHLFSQQAITIPIPHDQLQIDESVYLWRSQDEFAVASYWLGHYGEGAATCESLLEEGRVPMEHRQRILNNLKFCQQKLVTPAVQLL